MPYFKCAVALITDGSCLFRLVRPGPNAQTVKATHLRLYGTPQFSFTKFPANARAAAALFLSALLAPRDPPLRVSLMLSVSEGDLPCDE